MVNMTVTGLNHEKHWKRWIWLYLFPLHRIRVHNCTFGKQSRMEPIACRVIYLPFVFTAFSRIPESLESAFNDIFHAASTGHIRKLCG